MTTSNTLASRLPSAFLLGARLGRAGGPLLAAGLHTASGGPFRGWFLGCRLLGQVVGLEPPSGLPQSLQIVKATRSLGKNMDHEIYIIQQNPFRLVVAFYAIRTLSGAGELLLYFIGDRLDLARIGSGAHDEIVGKRSCGA